MESRAGVRRTEFEDDRLSSVASTGRHREDVITCDVTTLFPGDFLGMRPRSWAAVLCVILCSGVEGWVLMRDLLSRQVGAVLWVATVPKRSKEAMFDEYGRLVPRSICWSWRRLGSCFSPTVPPSHLPLVGQRKLDRTPATALHGSAYQRWNTLAHHYR